MAKEKIKQVFEKKIEPRLGSVRKKEKYLEIVVELAAHSRENRGKGMRAANFSSNLIPVHHALKRLEKQKCLKVTLPAGDGMLLIDPINNKSILFNKRKVFDEYLKQLKNHLEKNQEAQRAVRNSLKLKDEEELAQLLKKIQTEFDIERFDAIVKAITSSNIDVKSKGYGRLLWKRMANYYRLSNDILEEIEKN